MGKTTKKKAYVPVDRVDVYVCGHFVGAVAYDPGSRYYAFAYDRKFAGLRIELSPLQIPVNDCYLAH